MVALVELEEGTRLVTNLVDVAIDHLSFGMAVEVVYETFDGDVTLPLFRPTEGGHAQP